IQRPYGPAPIEGVDCGGATAWHGSVECGHQLRREEPHGAVDAKDCGEAGGREPGEGTGGNRGAGGAAADRVEPGGGAEHVLALETNGAAGVSATRVGGGHGGAGIAEGTARTGRETEFRTAGAGVAEGVTR